MAHAHIPIRTFRGVQQRLTVLRAPEPFVSGEAKGIVYTKRWVVELLLDLAGFTSDKNLVDAVAVEPAAGGGAFLGPMVGRLVDCCHRMGRSLLECRESLIAYELDRVSAETARAVIVADLVRREISPDIAGELAEAWVRTGDYLLESNAAPADYVIGNPPYVRLEEIPEGVAALYRDAYPTMHGRADLYVAFFEAALRQLRPQGVCAFICADRWMRNQYGAALRELITSEFAVDVLIEMHGADAFRDEVNAYPAITVIRRGEQKRAIVARASADAATIRADELVESLCSETLRGPSASSNGLRMEVLDDWFEGSSPWPYQSPGQLRLLRRLERNFPPLERHAKVGIGVATGNDGVFITRDAQLVEPSRLLKLALAEDIASGDLRWSGHFLVDPWASGGLVDLNRYPRLSAYLEEHAEVLRKRHTAAKNLRNWYRTIDRVSHSLALKSKLYIADIKSALEPVLDRGETYPHHNLYYVHSEVWDLEVLGGLLLSAVGNFFVRSYGVRMRGGYLRFQAQYLRRIRVPLPETLTSVQSQGLAAAFRARDREQATKLAFGVYGVQSSEMEDALGH